MRNVDAVICGMNALTPAAMLQPPSSSDGDRPMIRLNWRDYRHEISHSFDDQGATLMRLSAKELVSQPIRAFPCFRRPLVQQFNAYHPS